MFKNKLYISKTIAMTPKNEIRTLWIEFCGWVRKTGNHTIKVIIENTWYAIISLLFLMIFLISKLISLCFIIKNYSYEIITIDKNYNTFKKIKLNISN